MIRNIISSDFEFIYDLYMHPQINPFLLYEPMQKKAFEPIFNDLLQKNICFIYFNNELPVGMFKLIPETYRASHVVYLGGVAIKPNNFKTGLGTKMFEEILKYVKENGFLRIVLSVAVHNQAAINLYEKMGFIKEGVFKNYSHLKSEQKFIDEYFMAYLFPLPY